MASVSMLMWHSGLEPSRLSVVWKVPAACSDRCEAEFTANIDSASHVTVASASQACPLVTPFCSPPAEMGTYEDSHNNNHLAAAGT